MTNLQLVATEDGSVSLLDEETGELHHNKAGAFTEALHNYCIPSGAHQLLRDKGSVTILDACYGLGYNTLVTLSELAKAGASGTLNIVAVEIDPQLFTLSETVLANVHFDRLLSCFKRSGCGLPVAEGTYRYQIDGLQIHLELCRSDLRQRITTLSAPLDLVFHDPFTWRKVPELWSLELFQQYFGLMVPVHGRMLTYSLATPVRAALIRAGFRLFRTPRVGDKKGGTLAVAGDGAAFDRLQAIELSEVEQIRLSDPDLPVFRDKNLCMERGQILSDYRGNQSQNKVLL